MSLPRDDSLRWGLSDFDSLDRHALYEIMALRQRVFVVEQACAYLDLDGLDQEALHVTGRDMSAHLLAYARILPPGVSFETFAIGRVITAPRARGAGLGRELMRTAIRFVFETAGQEVPISLGAQSHLVDFYGSQGFEAYGDEYDEDGIPHRHMLRPARPVA